MVRLSLAVLVCACFFTQITRAEDDDDRQFSGPQVGESLKGFEAKGVREDSAGKKFDPIAQADGKPVLVVFIHELTRQGFGLARAISAHAVKQKDAPLPTTIVFLTDDPVETSEWAKKVQHYFDKKVNLGVSVDGKDGPGAYGLNRNVFVTVLVGNQSKVVGNFALASPQLQVDGPPILESIAKVTGGKTPKIEELVGERMRQMMKQRRGRESAKGAENPRGRDAARNRARGRNNPAERGSAPGRQAESKTEKPKDANSKEESSGEAKSGDAKDTDKK